MYEEGKRLPGRGTCRCRQGTWYESIHGLWLHLQTSVTAHFHTVILIQPRILGRKRLNIIR